ncbi:MAG: YihY/virulence factor BrkB family protein [Vicinamibacterales bacterium]
MLARLRVPLSWLELFKRTFNETLADDVLNLAAQQAYYFFFALFPALLALISIASFFPVQNLIDEITVMLGRVAPPDVLRIIQEQVLKLSRGNAGGVLTIAFLFTLWSSSSAVVSMCTTLNTAYDITEGRRWWKVRLTAIGLTVGLAIFILVSMTLVVVGPTLAEKIADTMQLGTAFEWTWKIVQWPVVFGLVVTAFALVYYFAPDAQQEWVWITPGAVLATSLWVVSSLGFKFYVANFASYNETYGAIGGVMVLLLWFYVSGIALLVGAELNAEIEHASPYGKNPGEKVIGENQGQTRQTTDVQPYPDEVNCDLDRPRPKSKGVRPSELLIGAAALLPAAAALLPAAIRVGRGSNGKKRRAA